MEVASLEDIIISPLDRIANPLGDILHALKSSDVGFDNFGEAYFSIINHNSIKAWKRHNKMTMNLIIPVGKIKIVFYDYKKNFYEEIVDRNNYVRITVPPKIWFGFKGLSKELNLLLNVSNIKNNDKELDRKNISEIYYDW